MLNHCAIPAPLTDRVYINGVIEPDFEFGMVAFDTNLSFGPFDPDLDPTSTGARFRKNLERFTSVCCRNECKGQGKETNIVFAPRWTQSVGNF